MSNGEYAILLLAIVVAIICVFNHFDKNEQIESIEEIVDDVEIVDSSYSPSYITYLPSGKITVPTFHSEEYQIDILYKDTIYTLYSEEIYEKYKNSLGIKTKAIIQIKKYKSGRIKENILDLE